MASDYLEAHRQTERVLRWRDRQIFADHPKAAEMGPDFHTYMPIYAKSARMLLVHKAAGTVGGDLIFPNEHVAFIVRGQWRVTIDGTVYHLEPNDMAFIPANVNYIMSTEGSEDGLYLSIYLLSQDAWPEGKPLSPPYDRPPRPTDRDSALVAE